MPEHLTRRELKSDSFTVSVEHAADYFGLHRRQILQIAGGVLLAVVLGLGIFLWMQHARSVRTEKLAEAMAVAEAPVGPAAAPGSGLSYATQAAKDSAELKVFSDLAGQYHGTREGAVAEYTLAGMAVTAGREDEARKRFTAAIDSGDKEYASLAKLALAQIDFSDGKPADGEKLLRDLMDHPTTVVSKPQATITLARMIAPTRPAEARELLKPLMAETGDVGQVATSAQADIHK